MLKSSADLCLYPHIFSTVAEAGKPTSISSGRPAKPTKLQQAEEGEAIDIFGFLLLARHFFCYVPFRDVYLLSIPPLKEVFTPLLHVFCVLLCCFNVLVVQFLHVTLSDTRPDYLAAFPLLSSLS